MSSTTQSTNSNNGHRHHNTNNTATQSYRNNTGPPPLERPPSNLHYTQIHKPNTPKHPLKPTPQPRTVNTTTTTANTTTNAGQPKQYNYVRSVAPPYRVTSPSSPRHPRAPAIPPSPVRPVAVVNTNTATNTHHIQPSHTATTAQATAAAIASALPAPPIAISSTTSAPHTASAPPTTQRRQRTPNATTNKAARKRRRPAVNQALREKLKQAYHDLRKYMPFELTYRPSAEILETYKLYPHMQNQPSGFRVLLVNFNLSQVTGGLRKEHGLQLIVEWQSSDRSTTHRRVCQSNISQLVTFVKRVKEHELDLATLTPASSSTPLKPTLLSEISGAKTTGTSGAFERLMYKCRRTDQFEPIGDILPRPRSYSTADIPVLLQRNEPLKIEGYEIVIQSLGIIDHVVIHSDDSDDSSDDDTAYHTPALAQLVDAATSSSIAPLITSAPDQPVTRSNSNTRSNDGDVLLCWWYADKPTALIKTSTQQLITACVDKFVVKRKVGVKSELGGNSSHSSASTVSDWYVDEAQVESIMAALSITAMQAMRATQLTGDIAKQTAALCKTIKEVQNSASIDATMTQSASGNAIPLRIDTTVNMIVVRKSHFQRSTRQLSSTLVSSDKCTVVQLTSTAKLRVAHATSTPFTPDLSVTQRRQIATAEHAAVAKYIKSLLSDQNFYLETLPHYTDATTVSADDPLCSQLFTDTPIIPTSMWQRNVGADLNIHTVIEWPYASVGNDVKHDLLFSPQVVMYWLQLYLRVTKPVKCVCVVPARLWPAATTQQSMVEALNGAVHTTDSGSAVPVAAVADISADPAATKRRRTSGKASTDYHGFRCNGVSVGRLALASAGLSAAQAATDTTVVDADGQSVGRQVFIVVELIVKPS